MNIKKLKSAITDGYYDKAFAELYGSDCDMAFVKARYLSCAEGFEKTYGDRSMGDVRIFSVSGRSEISGNHTDHNHGKVLAGSISLDIISVAATHDGNTVCVKSEGYNEDVISLDSVETIVEAQKNRAASLIRGVCDGFKKNGHSIGAFYAYTTSNVLKGSGLSSSAAFEDMIGNMLNHLYNDGKVDNIEIAKIAQYAENVHFGKPCGLMDQMACGVGGFIAIDFKDPKNPIVEKLDFDLDKYGLNLCIVNTGGNHADLTDDYTSVPVHMKSVAKELGVNVLRESSKEKLLSKANEIRKALGDRAFMRAMHFYNENDRVTLQKEALKNGELDTFLGLVIKSGISSFTMLQNVYTTKNVEEQGLSLALALSQEVLEGEKHFAYRVHGGGFAGTIQCYVPKTKTKEFKETLENVFGQGTVYVLNIRKYGAVCLDKLQ